MSSPRPGSELAQASSKPVVRVKAGETAENNWLAFILAVLQGNWGRMSAEPAAKAEPK